MNVGMLWFDNDPKVELDTKLERAADYYRKKYGRAPTLCFVHPRMLNNLASGQPAQQPGNGNYVSKGIEVRPNRSVLPNHFWIGVNGTSEAEPA